MKLKKKWIITAVISPFLLFVVLFLVPITRGVTYYAPALDVLAGKHHSNLSKGKYHPELGVDPGQDYALFEGKLYLKYQDLGRSLMLQFVDQIKWTEKDIAEFRKMHPELEEYWVLTE